MSYEYSAQNHDWDLTLHAAAELINAGLVMDRQPRTGTLSMGFPFFTGGMVLSFAAIESFSASVAFSIQSDGRFSGFSSERYQAERRFWDRMDMLMSAVGIKVDKSKGLFQRIGKMQEWRNLVSHASPYEIASTEIMDTIKAPRKLHLENRRLEYARIADAENAKKFYRTAAEYISLLKAKSGHDPRASASYAPLSGNKHSSE